MAKNRSKNNSQKEVAVETEVAYIATTNIKHNGVLIPMGSKYKGDNIKEFLAEGLIKPSK